MAFFCLGYKVKMIGHKAPCVNRQAFIINKVIKSMYYHLFVYGTDKYVDPIDRIKGDKKTGLFSVDMVITKAHFSIIFLNLAF